MAMELQLRPVLEVPSCASRASKAWDVTYVIADVDSKLELGMRGLDVDREDDLERVEELEMENEELR